jgi:putative ATP-dependent endonuclease of OLD family
MDYLAAYVRVYLSSVAVRGFRAAAEHELVCELPGRFSVLLGDNDSGKTTVADALYLAHPHTFPALPRPGAATLGPVTPRHVEVAYRFEPDPLHEGPLGRWLSAASLPAPRWTRMLQRSMGRVRAQMVETPAEVTDPIRLIYLPAARNPLGELARRDAQLMVEVLRAGELDRHGRRSLSGLRAAAGLLLGGDDRRLDDRSLARIAETVLGLARGAETSGLGHAALLYLALVLASIPASIPTSIPTSIPASIPAATPGADSGAADAPVPEEERVAAAEEEAEAAEDAFFPDLFHVTVVIEEPEAHLSPPLRYRLARHLRELTAARPELQVVLTTHAGEVAAAADPSELVLLRREPDGRRVSRRVGGLPVPDRVLREAARHLDATRSAGVFADRGVVVGDAADALLVRPLARTWAGGDEAKQRFADTLAITVAPGQAREPAPEPAPWPVELLATPGHELVGRLAVLGGAGADTGVVRYFRGTPEEALPALLDFLYEDTGAAD